MTYFELKEKFYNDEFPLLSEATRTQLAKALDNWFGVTPFDDVTSITGINPMDYPEDLPEGAEVEEQDRESYTDIQDRENYTTIQTRDEALDEAKAEWDKMSLEIKFGHFVDITDNAEELQQLLKA